MQFLRPDRDIHLDGVPESSASVIYNRHRHLPLRHQRELLPIFRVRKEILYLVEKFRAVVLIGETGCGKSTQLPLYLHESGWTRDGHAVVCTQPRRIAAVTVSSRVADEFGCKLGEEVGYGIRFDFKCSEKTKIKYYTDGVLLRETMTDPLLSKYSVIIVDEAHQRSLHSDILMGLLKKIQRKRPELRIIITSATLDAVSFKNFFETNITDDPSKDSAAIMSIQGRQHPVDIYYLSTPCQDYVEASVDTILLLHRQEEPGDVLVFLPGMEEIDDAMSLLQDRYHGDTLWVLPLHSSLPHHLQLQAFQPTPNPTIRKVVIATNIAEASVTIEGIRYVIDSGFVNLNYFDVRTGLEALVTVPVSQAAATQRAGRAGRTQPGKCYRLFCEDALQSLPEHSKAEMQRVDISWAVLQLKALGIHDVLHFDFLSVPSVDAMVFALELLFSLGAIDDKCRVTPLGIQMAEMPLEPRVAKCLLSSPAHGCCEEMLSIAAMTSVDYPFVTIRKKTATEAKKKLQRDMEHFAVVGSDHLTLLRVYREFVDSNYSASWCDSNSLLPKVLARAKEIRSNLSMLLKRYMGSDMAFTSCGDDDKAVRRCLIAGYFSHAARLHNDGVYRTLRGDVVVQPFPSSVVALYGAPPEWVIYHEVVRSKVTSMREITRIEPLWLHELAPHYYNLKM